MGNSQAKSEIGKGFDDVDPLNLSQRESAAAWHRSGVAVTDVYDIVDVLGQGRMGEVYKVRRKVEERGMHNVATRNKTSEEASAPSSSKKSPFKKIKKKMKGGKQSPDNGMVVPDDIIPSHEPPPSPKAIPKKSILKKKSDLEAPQAEGIPAPPVSVEISTSTRRKTAVRFQRLYACKTVSTARVKKGFMEELMNEIMVMRTLDHPYILQLFEVYQVKRKLWLVTELCTGGDLSKRKLNEAEVTVVVEQILRALAYMHRMGVMHRDLKLENILYEHSGQSSTIRLIDFGLSQTFDRAEKGREVAGTAYSISPEIAAGTGEYTEKSDMWSVGVIAWVLLAGDFPFVKDAEELNDKAKLECLVKAQIRFGITWKGRGISMKAKDFVRGCLQQRPEKRWTAKEALEFLQNTWIPSLNSPPEPEKDGSESDTASVSSVDSNTTPTDGKKPKMTEKERVLNRSIAAKRRKDDETLEKVGIKVEDIERFCMYGLMKKTILMTMAHTMDRRDVGRLREIFLTADTEDSGTISLLELKQAFKKLSPSTDEKSVERIFEGIDHDHSGQIHYAEFLAALSESHGLITMERLSEAFDRIDTEGKGYISHNDLKAILGKDYDKDLVDKMIEEADFKKNGQIDYEELLQLMFEDPQKGDKAVGDVKTALRSLDGLSDLSDSMRHMSVAPENPQNES